MKTLLLLLCVVCIGCSQSLDRYDGIQSKDKTSLTVLSNIDSTLQVSITQDRIYVLQEGKVVRDGYLTTNKPGYVLVLPVVLGLIGLAFMALWSIFVGWIVERD